MITGKKLVTINFLSLFIISLVHGTMYKNISTFANVEEYCKKAIEKYNNKNLLIAWDVDDTLLRQTSSLFFYNNIYVDSFFIELERVEDEEGKDAYNKLYSSYMQNEPLDVIDKKMPIFIQSLQEKKNIKNIAITAIPWDSFGHIKNTKEWRFNQLKTVGIDFSQSFPTMSKISLSTDKGENGISPIVSHFDSGILYTRTTAKGTSISLLIHALKKYSNWTPELIIFIDDRESNVESVHDAYNDNEHINCLGLHVAFEKKMPPKLDKKIAEFQIDYFKKNRTWISDKKAKDLYKN